MKDRNVFEQAEKGKKMLSPKRDLCVGEMSQLLNIYDNNRKFNSLWDIIGTAFYFGAVVGYRQAKTDEKKRVKKVHFE